MRVEPDFSVGEIIVVDQQQVRHRLTRQPWNVGPLVIDVELDPIGAQQLLALRGVEADRQSMGSKRGEVFRGALHDGRRGDHAVLDLDFGRQGVDPGGLQPQL